jgi:hypothetical protein
MRTRAAAERAARRRQRAQRSEVRPGDVDLDDDGVVGVVQGDELVALIGKGSSGLGEVAANRLLAVIDIAGGDELVARMPEGGDRRVEVMRVLRTRCSRTTASRRARRSALSMGRS